MILIFWYCLMLALLWSVLYRSALSDKTTRFCIRLGLTVTGVGSAIGMFAPIYGWTPDGVTVVIVMSIVNMQIAFAKFWKHGVPGQYVKPEYKDAHRRATDLGDWA